MDRGFLVMIEGSIATIVLSWLGIDTMRKDIKKVGYREGLFPLKYRKTLKIERLIFNTEQKYVPRFFTAGEILASCGVLVAFMYPIGYLMLLPTLFDIMEGWFICFSISVIIQVFIIEKYCKKPKLPHVSNKY